jgi:hypothetical protein
VDGAGAAQEATVEEFIDFVRALEGFFQQAVQKGELAARRIDFATRNGEKWAHRPAHATSHTASEAIFQVLDDSSQPFYVPHQMIPAFPRRFPGSKTIEVV